MKSVTQRDKMEFLFTVSQRNHCPTNPETVLFLGVVGLLVSPLPSRLPHLSLLLPLPRRGFGLEQCWGWLL